MAIQRTIQSLDIKAVPARKEEWTELHSEYFIGRVLGKLRLVSVRTHSGATSFSVDYGKIPDLIEILSELHGDAVKENETNGR
jgi:hypothetical protein